MKRTISFICLCFVALYTMAQTKGPEFPGGEAMLRQFLKENVQYPFNIESRKTYNVKAEVLVAKDGTVKLFDILRPKSLKREIANETKRIIKIMPKWNPGGRYADDGTFVPEQWKTVIYISFNPKNDCHEETMTCINVEKAGTLESLLTEKQKDTCSQLRIIGKINSVDIITLRKMAGENGSLAKLDLSGARIVGSKEPYLVIEDAEEKVSLWSRMVRGGYSYTPGWVRIPDSEREEFWNSWGTQNQNNQYPSSPSRYMSPTPYKIPYRERTHANNFRDTFKRWWSGDSNSYGQRAMCLFEDSLKQLPGRKILKMKPTRLKGHRLERDGEEYILSAYTVNNSFCPDMFYNCPKLKHVIMPIKASVNERLSIAGSKVKFWEVRKPKY